MSEQSDNTKRVTVYAPNNSDATVPGAILSAVINEDETIEWVWAHLENGKSAVTGYNIIKKKNGSYRKVP